MKIKFWATSKLTYRTYTITVEGDTFSDCYSKAEETYDYRDYDITDWEYWEV